MVNSDSQQESQATPVSGGPSAGGPYPGMTWAPVSSASRPPNWRSLGHASKVEPERTVQARVRAAERAARGELARQAQEAWHDYSRRDVPERRRPNPRRASKVAQRHKEAGDGKCEVCGWAPPEARLLNAHHVVPRSRGGTDEPSNWAVLCPNHHAMAHYVSPRGHKAGYWGPRTREALFERIRVLETGGRAWYHALFSGGVLTKAEAAEFRAKTA